MKTYHLLNGDALIEKIQGANITGEVIICRECLIEGETLAGSLEEFCKARSKFISRTYSVTIDSYFEKCVFEFEKILNLQTNSEVNLWFENDLFCQVNMWFILSLISKV